MNAKWITPLMIAMFSGALVAGFAGSVGAKHTTSFNELDEDKDGHISQQEADGHPMLVDHFKRFDNDNNGKLDQAEFSRFETMERDMDRMKQDKSRGRGPGLPESEHW